MIKKKLLRLLVPIALLAFMVWGGYIGVRDRTTYSYMEHLDEVAVTVDGEDITLRDMLFYVAFEERKVEDDAASYNPDNTIEYWNIHTNGAFFKDIVKDTVMGMAVHDAILYKQADESNIILNSSERTSREDAKTDFWSDLYDIQLERLEGYEEIINTSIDHVALAQKYQGILAEKEDKDYHDLDWDGEVFEEYKSSHDIVINKKVWKRIVFGDVTLDHKIPSFLPTKKSERKEEKESQ